MRRVSDPARSGLGRAAHARRRRRMLGTVGGRRRAGARFESQLVWLLGSPRSGSTWLLTLLSEHRDVAPIDEPLIGEHLAPFLCDLPGCDPSDLDVGNFTFS